MSRRAITAAVTTAGLAPLGWLAWRAANDGLGADPVEEITHATGEWALRFLVASLAVTPARRLVRGRLRTWLAPQRRTLGLLAWFWALLHFSTYVSLDLFFDFSLLAEDIAERPYITVGFATFVMLCALASTSTKRSIRRLGARWLRLHQLVYIAAITAVLHFLWLVKADLREPLIYAGVVATLLGTRLYRHFQTRAT